MIESYLKKITSIDFAEIKDLPLEEFKSFLTSLKQNNKKNIIEILETWCNSFKSDGEDIPEGLEDEIYSLIVEL